jgi:DNA polymerase III alpha subunit
MLPLFKSCFSIGKSILTLEDSSDPDGADSIIEICKDNNVKKMILVEDSMTGFMKAVKACESADIQLVFGLRIGCVNSMYDEDQNSLHKIVIFAKNDNGCNMLNRIVSAAEIEGKGNIDCNYLNNCWCDDLEMFIPFYDSFIFKNNTSLSNCIPDFRAMKPKFFVERNGLPFDSMIESLVEKYCEGKYETVLAKSIFYKNKEDVEALQTYKILCSRTFGKAATLSSPQLDHFGSNEFCFESYLNHAERTTSL